MNLWPVVDAAEEDARGERGLDAILEGLRAITLPLRDRLAPDGGPFGVGLWIPADVAAYLASHAPARGRWLTFLAAERLDAFTFNAFPFGDFHRAGLKAGVFQPDWLAPERAAFTCDVATLGSAVAEAFDWGPDRHLSISTHTGGHLGALLTEHTADAAQGTQPSVVANATDSRETPRQIKVTGQGAAPGDDEAITSLRAQVAEQFAKARMELERTSAASADGLGAPAPRIVLGLEPEPRSLAGDTRELIPLAEAIARAVANQAMGAPAGAEAGLGVRSDCAPSTDSDAESGAVGTSTVALGVCLDACHAAVEFEGAVAAAERATRLMPLAKLQYSSAVRLTDPGSDPEGFAALLAQDEPVYLHQVTGRQAASDGAEHAGAQGGPSSDVLPDQLRRAADLTDLAAAPGTWRALDELRCHFHVPVDLAAVGRLDTTAAFASELLDHLLAHPERWGTRELHVEIETYTWSLGGFDGAPRQGHAHVVDGIEAEYRHVLAQLAAAGWQPAMA